MDKIVKVSDVESTTRKGFPGCELVKFIWIETERGKYKGAFVAGVRNGLVIRSNGLSESDVELEDEVIKAAIKEGKTSPTTSNGWWLQ